MPLVCHCPCSVFLVLFMLFGARAGDFSGVTCPDQHVGQKPPPGDPGVVSPSGVPPRFQPPEPRLLPHVTCMPGARNQQCAPRQAVRARLPLRPPPGPGHRVLLPQEPPGARSLSLPPVLPEPASLARGSAFSGACGEPYGYFCSASGL